MSNTQFEFRCIHEIGGVIVSLAAVVSYACFFMNSSISACVYDAFVPKIDDETTPNSFQSLPAMCSRC